MDRFFCTFCGASLQGGDRSVGAEAECLSCGRFSGVPKKGDFDFVLGRELPEGVLALEMKFLCPGCGRKLRCELELEGTGAECPECGMRFKVPLLSHRKPPSVRLSAEEVEFLSALETAESA